MAALCIVTLAAGVYSLRLGSDEGSAAIAVGATAGASPEATGSPPGQTPPPAVDPPPIVAGAVSLSDLAGELMARAATSTTRPRATTTTKKAPVTTVASSPATTATTPARAAAPPATTSTTTPLTPLTTLLKKVTPPVAAATGGVTRSASGIASWFNAPDATCAHLTLPMGTIVKVTRIHNGASTTCKVNDRGPTLETGRLIDLSLDTFEKLAPSETGLIDVTIEW